MEQARRDEIGLMLFEYMTRKHGTHFKTETKEDRLETRRKIGNFAAAIEKATGNKLPVDELLEFAGIDAPPR